jgi:hypothetical protein
MVWDRDERTLWLLHSSLGIRSPVTFSLQQFRLALGMTCPRHRRLLKDKLGPFGRLVPFREWNDEQSALVSIWSEAEADAQYERPLRLS